ncbi:hypothetical protein [Kitasatospora sp. NPDC088351]|uniref:hypothetical protein n=1 Tax=Kitasatospora sp. NPDC088351 TaxID=3155180 RepID=UPI00342A6ECA
MTADRRRPLRQPFSSPIADPSQAGERRRLLPVERSPFQQPPAAAPDHSRRPAADGHRALGPGGLAFTPPGPQD